jgi:hypothetical protein
MSPLQKIGISALFGFVAGGLLGLAFLPVAGG